MGDQNQAIKSQVVHPHEIAAAASSVAKYLRVRHVSKKHGGHDIYEDDRLAIWLDTYVPNVSIRLMMDGQWVVVFSASYASWGNPTTFHAGAWCDYLLGPLLARTKPVREELERARRAREDAELVKQYAPIADAHLFPEVVQAAPDDEETDACDCGCGCEFCGKDHDDECEGCDCHTEEE